MKLNFNAKNSGTVDFPPRFGKSLAELRAELMKDPKFREEFYKLDLEGLALELKVIRLIKGITQKQLAKKLGTSQPAIARFEREDYKPSIEFVDRVAKELGYHLDIKLQERS